MDMGVDVSKRLVNMVVIVPFDQMQPQAHAH